MSVIREAVRAAARRAWLLRNTHGPAVRLPGSPRVGVVLLSYAREQNMDGILRAVGKCSFVDQIVLSHNNPDTTIRDQISFTDPRLQIIEQQERKRPGVRWNIALDLLRDAEIVVCIDDDVFITPRQIKRLVEAAIANPQAVHGFAGSVAGEYVSGSEIEVDHLVRLYVVHQAHVKRYFELIDAMQVGVGEVDRVGDDIVISLAGQAPPRIHDIGPVLSCKTSLVQGIAVNQETGFDEARMELLAEALRARQALRPAAL